MDPALPDVDLAERFGIGKYPLLAKGSFGKILLEIYGQSREKAYYLLIQQQIARAVSILDEWLPFHGTCSIIIRVIETDEIPANYSYASPQRDGCSYEDLIFLPKDTARWDTAIGPFGVQSTLHETAHALLHASYRPPWFEEGLCDYLSYLYLSGPWPEQADRMLKEAEKAFADEGAAQRVWSFDPPYAITVMEETIRQMKIEGKDNATIVAFIKDYWRDFDRVYAYAFGVIHTIAKKKGRVELQCLIKRYYDGSISAEELNRIGQAAIRGSQ